MNKIITKISFLVVISILIILVLKSYNGYRKIVEPIDKYDMIVLKRKIEDFLFFTMADTVSIEIVLNDSSFSNSFRQRNDLRLYYDSLNDSMTIYSIGFDKMDDRLKNLFAIDGIKFIDYFFKKGDYVIAEFGKPIRPSNNIVSNGVIVDNYEFALSLKKLFVGINNSYYKEFFDVEIGVTAILKPQCAEPIGLLVNTKNKTVKPVNSKIHIDPKLLDYYIQGISSLDTDSIDLIYLNLSIASSKNCFSNLN